MKILLSLVFSLFAFSALAAGNDCKGSFAAGNQKAHAAGWTDKEVPASIRESFMRSWNDADPKTDTTIDHIYLALSKDQTRAIIIFVDNPDCVVEALGPMSLESATTLLEGKPS